MLRIALTVLIALHAAVHGLYVGHALGWFSMKEGLAWPAGSWVFSRVFGELGLRITAAVGLATAAAGLAAAALLILLHHPGQRILLAAAAAVSMGMFIVLWNGSPQQAVDSGLIGVLIDAGLLLAVLFLL